MSSRRDLRRSLRAKRRAVPPPERIAAAQAAAGHLLRYLARRRPGRLAAFVAADGELDPGPAIAAARSLGHRIHLPVIDEGPRGGLRFLETAAGQELVANRFGIAEPQAGRECRPRALDLVLVPLVAHDAAGNRLGMGAGFYDRSFAFRRRFGRWRHPILLGVAWPFQLVAELTPKQHDVALDGVLTPDGLLWFKEQAG